MLKNVGKYNRLKPIDLDKFKTSNKNMSNTGISTESYGNVWFLLPKGRAIFKTFDDNIYPVIRKIRYINELVCCELAKMINLPCAEYEPAIKKRDGDIKKGLVSYKVNKPGQKLETLYDVSEYICSLNFNEIYLGINEQTEEEGMILDKNFKFDLFKMITFDLLTMQQDRHFCNIHVIDDKKNNFRSFAPLIDNEMAFGALTINEYLKNDMPLVIPNIIEDMDYTPSVKYVKMNEAHKYCQNIRDLVVYAKGRTKYFEFLQNTIKNFDIKKAIKNVEEEGTTIPEQYQKYMIRLTDEIKRVVVNKIREICVDNEEEQYL